MPLQMSELLKIFFDTRYNGFVCFFLLFSELNALRAHTIFLSLVMITDQNGFR